MGRVPWLHVGPQQRTDVAELAALAGGAIAQPGRSSSAIQRLRAAHVPLALQQAWPDEQDQARLWEAHEEWLGRQHGVAFMTTQTQWIPNPSKLGIRELKPAIRQLQLEVVLAREREAGTTCMAMLAVEYRWLTQEAHRARLIAELSDFGGPVGLMLSKDRDPLDSAKTVEGLITLLREVPKVAVLRCDNGAIGALAFGAVGASIGLTGGTRHFPPPETGGYADLSDNTPRLLVPSILAWWKGSRLSYMDDDWMFRCNCSVCRGQSLTRFQDESLRHEAEAHSVAAWIQLAREVMSDPSGPERGWIQRCEQANQALEELEDSSGLVENPSRQLTAWLDVVGART